MKTNKSWKIAGIPIIAGLLLATAPLRAQTVTATVGTGANPATAAVNPVTNKIYVANANSNNVTVIDGATNNTTTVATGTQPAAEAVNPITNKIYVANFASNNVTVIDGATNNTVTVTNANGIGPFAVVVNPVTNKIYVANQTSGNVTVIDGVTNAASTVGAGTFPIAVALNPVTNKIYVANGHGANVTVIDGATNNTATVATGTKPTAVAVNPVTNEIYVPNTGSNNVTVIDGATNNTTTVAAGTMPFIVALNPVTNKIYVTNVGSNDVTVIDGATNNTVTVAAGMFPDAAAVDTLTNQIYVGNFNSNNITVIDGATNSTATLAAGSGPEATALNPVTNKIYVGNSNDNTVTVVDGATNGTATVMNGNGLGPESVALNPSTNKIYVANFGSDNVTVIDGATNTFITVSDPNAQGPDFVAVNPVTNQIYVANFTSNNVTVIDGATNAVTTVTDPNAFFPEAVAVNPVTNQIYVANEGLSTGGNVTVIDGATNNTTTVAAGTFLRGIAVDTVRNQIYVANQDSNNVTVIDGVTNNIFNVVTDPNAIGPYAIAVNEVANNVYVANNGSANVTIINVGVYASTVPVGSSPVAVAVNSVTNQIYVANMGSSFVTVIDGNGTVNTTTSVTTAGAPNAIAVNPVTNKIYVGQFSGTNVTVIDGATNATTTVAAGGEQFAIAVNPLTNKVYVDNFSTNNVTVITEEQVQPIPLVTTINPLTGNTTNNPTQSFHFSPASTFAPTAPPPNAVYFQFDTFQGPWTAATFVAGVGYTGMPSTLGPGTHTLYAFATDGQDATSVMTTSNGGSSPLIGTIAAYTFTVTNPPGPTAFFSQTAINFGDVNVGSVSDAQPVYVTNIGLSDLVFTSSGPAGGANPGDFIIGDTCAIQGTLSTNQTCLTTVAFHPTAAGIRSADFPYTDNAADSPQLLVLNGTGLPAAPPPNAQLNPTTLTFAGQTVNTTSAAQTVTLTNTGGSKLVLSATPLTFGSVAAGDYAAAAGTTCTANLSIAPNGTCIVNVTFTPAATGSRPATLTFTDDSGGTAGSTQQVILSGTGTPAVPMASVLPVSLTFAGQTVSTTSAAQFVSVANNGGMNLVLAATAAVAISGPNMGDFAIATGTTCTNGLSIPNPGTCTINVTFTPTATGTRTATLTITDNSGGVAGSTQTVSLSGTGSVSVQLASIIPTAVPFGSQAVNATSAAQTVTLKNVGGSPLLISNGTPLVLNGANPGDFAIVAATTTCAPNLSIPANGSCVINVTFTPTATGSRSATLVINDNSGGTPSQQNVTLSGTGVTPVPLANVTPTSVAFPNQTVNTLSSAFVIMVINSSSTGGTLTLGATPITFGGANPGDFSVFVAGTTCTAGLSIPAGGPPCDIQVNFTPAAAGPRSGTMIVTDNSGNVVGATQTVTLTGTGVAAAPPLAAVTPATITFASPQPVNTTSSGSPPLITVRNNGVLPLILGATPFALSGANPGDFASTTGTTCTANLSITSFCQIALNFTPSAVGARSATLTVTDNSGGTAGSTQTVSISGTGALAPSNITATGGTPQSTTVGTAFAAPFVATVKNAAGAPVSGVTVFFNTPEGGATGTFPGGSANYNATTNANGVATSGILTANNVAGSYAVTASVQGTQLSANFSLTNNNPAPTLTSISPTSGTVGQSVTLTLTGTNFVSGAIVNFGSNSDSGGLESDGTSITITIPAAQLSEAGPVSVTVTNPAPTAGPSGAQTFTINNSGSTANLVIAINGPVVVPVSTLTFTFSVESVGGLAGALNTTCSSATINCAVSPCPVPLIANRSAMLTGALSPLSTTSTGFKPGTPEWQLPPGWRLGLLCVACLLLAGLMSVRRQSVRWGLAGAALAFGLLAGCGGGSSNAQQNAVPAGQYTLNITAKLGNVTQTTQVTVKVQ